MSILIIFMIYNTLIKIYLIEHSDLLNKYHIQLKNVGTIKIS